MTDPTTNQQLAELRRQVADNMADVVVGPLIARIDRAEGALRRICAECGDTGDPAIESLENVDDIAREALGDE